MEGLEAGLRVLEQGDGDPDRIKTTGEQSNPGDHQHTSLLDAPVGELLGNPRPVLNEGLVVVDGKVPTVPLSPNSTAMREQQGRAWDEVNVIETQHFMENSISPGVNLVQRKKRRSK